MVANYLPWFLIASGYCFGLYQQPFVYSSFWGWVKILPSLPSGMAFVWLWFFTGGTVTTIILAVFALEGRHLPHSRKRSLFILIGYAIPLVIGAFTQAISPLLFHTAPIPVGSTLALSMVLIIFSLGVYKIFSLAESVDTERMVEMMQELVLVVSPRHEITYLNAFAAEALNFSPHDNRSKTIAILFPEEKMYSGSFEEQVLIPAFANKAPTHYQFSMFNKAGKRTHWGITAYPIMNRQFMEGLLIVGKDMTDRVLMTETKLVALRSQMNPHFIFNALNSIQYYVHNNKQEEAEKYLESFSKLIRQILHQSGEALISLSEEISMLRNYMAIENSRLKGAIGFRIDIEEGIDQEQVLLPSMLIQPYVENAIVHGLAGKGGGQIAIKIHSAKAVIHCTIEDNGIGREKAARLRSNKIGQNPSLGMSITKTRLQMINQLRHNPVAVNITDLRGKDGTALGTRVEIEIPAEES